MTHAHVGGGNAHAVCIVEFTYDEQAKNAVKALAGSQYGDGVWFVAIMHLPTLKAIFSSMDVEPEVVQAYHALLRRMLCDLLGHEGSKAAKELLTKHAVGIAAIEATGWKPTKQARPHHVTPQPVAGPVEAKDAGLAVWFTGVKNAAKAEETKSHIVKARRRKVKANA